MASQDAPKQGFGHSYRSGRPQPMPHKRYLVLLLAAIVLTSILQLKGPSQPLDKAQRLPFEFGNIKPSKDLQYHACFEGYQCARLEVPMDWNATEENGATIAIALIKKPAVVPVSHPKYGGVILFNPGGPGGSGVWFMLRYGDHLRKILEPKGSVNAEPILPYGDAKYFDLLSWDPRGVNNTTPGFSCFPSHLNRQAWKAQDEAIGFALGDNNIFSKIWSRERAHAESCSSFDPLRVGKTDGDNEHLGSYVSTAYVVRDMVEIIERHGEWREKETAALLGASGCRKQNRQEILEHTAWRKGEEQLQYWGFSYGTLLGQAFASMQPHRVGRLVLDGVVDAPDYAGTGWSTHLNDVGKIITNFTINCYEAGPQRCGFFNADGPPKIRANLDALLQKLESAPVPAWTEQGPTSITRSDTLMMIFNGIYTPTASFPRIANLLSDLSKGNGTAFAELKAVRYESSCSRDGKPVITDTADASMAVVCSDGDDLTGMSREDYLEYIDFLNRQSPYFGNRWALIKLPCLAYTIRAKWRFAGPFGTETAHPILFASQSLDPVTPLRNAVSAAKLFPESAVVEATGMGHTTLAMPSVCTAKTIREYFQTGALPENGRKCPIDVRPFDEEDKRYGYEGTDGDLLDALVEISKTWPWSV